MPDRRHAAAAAAARCFSRTKAQSPRTPRSTSRSIWRPSSKPLAKSCLIIVRGALAQAGKCAEELDHCFLQTISLATDEAVRRDLGIARDRFHSRVDDLGSGGSGGIVMAMLARATRTLSSGRCTSALAGIGAGLAWSSAVLSTDRVVCLDPIEM